jgi:leader peptidase (prepilin peptidase)/N-methyltransferase
MRGGRCSYCNKKSSFWYPFLEIVSGLLFAVSYLIYGFEYEMLAFIILTILTIMIFVSDFKYFIILDKPIWFLSIIILIAKWYTFGFKTFVESVCAGILIFLFMYSIRYFANMIFKRDSLGGGDIKLSTFFGVLVAIRLSVVSLCLGSFLAFPYALYYSILDKKKEIPFGPFLILGLFVVFVFMEPINTFIAIIFK